MLYAYSDAAVRNNHAVATTLLLSEDKFIDLYTAVYNNVYTNPQGELLGVIQALEALKTCVCPEPEVIIMSDSASIVKVANDILRDKHVPNNINHRNLWQKLLRLCKGLNVRITHVRSHRDEHNPNKVCARIANNTLKQVV